MAKVSALTKNFKVMAELSEVQEAFLLSVANGKPEVLGASTTDQRQRFMIELAEKLGFTDKQTIKKTRRFLSEILNRGCIVEMNGLEVRSVLTLADTYKEILQLVGNGYDPKSIAGEYKINESNAKVRTSHAVASLREGASASDIPTNLAAAMVEAVEHLYHVDRDTTEAILLCDEDDEGLTVVSYNIPVVRNELGNN